MTIASRTRPLAASAAMAAAIVLTVAEPAFAQITGIETIFQNIVDILTGSIFRSFAIISVILIAIAWMFGYMDLRRAGFWIVGIGVIAGSAELVDTIIGS
jgi:type IV secretion system protein VirB2